MVTQNSAPEGAQVHKYIAKNLGLRAAFVNATGVVQEMQKILNTYPLATQAVGRSMLASLLMASMSKNNHQVSLYFRGNGPLEMFFAEANYEGHVRGYTPNPHVILAEDFDPIDLKAGIGIGLLTVVNMHPTLGTPQRGTVEIRSGEVAEDVAYYLKQSQQVSAIVSVGVKLNSYGLVQAAGGFIVELLPGASDGLIEQLETHLKTTGSLSEQLAQGASVDEIKDTYLKDIPVVRLAHPFNVSYTCRCSEDKLLKAIELLGLEEVDSIISKSESVDAKCEFCGRSYSVEGEKLKELRNSIYKKSLN